MLPKTVKAASLISVFSSIRLHRFSLTTTYSAWPPLDTTLAGNIFLGEGGSDQINVNGNFISGLDPLTNNAYDLGTNGKNWKDGFF